MVRERRNEALRGCADRRQTGLAGIAVLQAEERGIAAVAAQQFVVLASLDDPWIPGRLYSDYDWSANKALVPLLPSRGGHVGFHGIGDKRPWSDLAVARFFGHG